HDARAIVVVGDLVARPLADRERHGLEARRRAELPVLLGKLRQLGIDVFLGARVDRRSTTDEDEGQKESAHTREATTTGHAYRVREYYSFSRAFKRCWNE